MPFGGVTVRRFSKAKSVADRLGICPRTVFRWADAGKITRHKINACVGLFDEAKVAVLIDSGGHVRLPDVLARDRLAGLPDPGKEVVPHLPRGEKTHRIHISNLFHLKLPPIRFTLS